MGLTPGLMQLLAQAALKQGTPPIVPPPGGGTSQLNSALFPSLFPQMPQQPDTAVPSGGVLPPSSPFPTSPGVDPELLNRATQMGMQETGAQLQRARGAGDAAMQAIGAEAAIPIPKMGWLDTQGQPPKPGFGHALARTLLALAASTGPGQAIEAAQYGPGIRRYASETASKAKQIEELQNQQQREETPLASTSGMIYHPMMAAARQETADAAMMRAKAYTEYTQKIIPIRQGLMNIAQGNLTEKQRHDKVAEFLTSQGIQVQRDRNGVIYAIGMGGQELKADEFNAAVANKNQELIQQILQSLGLKAFQGVPSPTGDTAVQPMAPGSQQPFKGPAVAAPTAPTNKANKIKTIRNKPAQPAQSKPGDPLGIL